MPGDKKKRKYSCRIIYFALHCLTNWGLRLLRLGHDLVSDGLFSNSRNRRLPVLTNMNFSKEISMKKSLLALAVAGAVAVPYASVQAAEVTISGYTQIDLYLSSSSKTGSNISRNVAEDSDGMDVRANDINLNIGVTEDVGFATAFSNYRIDIDGLSGWGGDTADSVKVGLKGDFGTVTLGEGADHAAKGQMAGDILIVNPNIPNAALSYASPGFEGFTFGLNIIADADVAGGGGNLANAGGVIATEHDQNGMGFGVGYATELGGVGLEVGFGQSNVTQTHNAPLPPGGGSTKIDEVGTIEQAYTSFGAKVSFAPVYLAFAQQSVSQSQNPDGGNKAEIEGRSSTDIKVGITSGPISAAVTNSSGTGFRSIADVNNQANQAKGADDQTSSVTRLDASYALSSNVSASFRFQSMKDSVDSRGANSDSESSFTRVGLAVTF